MGMPTLSNRHAIVAQLVEQLICNQPVGGSTPLDGSIGELAQMGEHLPCTQKVKSSNLLFSTIT
jgi:hypothetical protein